MLEPLIINPEINRDYLFNIKHRVVDAAKHARRLLAPRLGFTDAIDRFTGYQGLSNFDRLFDLATSGQIGMAVIANDPSGQEAGLVVAEKGVRASSDLGTKTGIFITAWYVGKEEYRDELAILAEAGITLGRRLESRLEDNNPYDGIFSLERLKKDNNRNKNRISRIKDKALTVIEAPVDDTALEVLHSTIVGVGFTAANEASWNRTRATSVDKKDENGNRIADEQGDYVKVLEQLPSDSYTSILYSID